MGVGGISIWQLLIVLIIVLLLFGTKKIRGIGSDLGDSIKSFRKAMKEGKEAGSEDEEGETDPEKIEERSGEIIEGEVTSVEKDKA